MVSEWQTGGKRVKGVVQSEVMKVVCFFFVFFRGNKTLNDYDKWLHKQLFIGPLKKMMNNVK